MLPRCVGSPRERRRYFFFSLFCEGSVSSLFSYKLGQVQPAGGAVGTPTTASITAVYTALSARVRLQHVKAGDLINFVPGANLGMWVESFEPNRWILVRDKKGEAIWAWQLYLLGEGRTRLITRLWMRDAWASPMIIYCPLQDVGDI
jgi:hypothetical protein